VLYISFTDISDNAMKLFHTRCSPWCTQNFSRLLLACLCCCIRTPLPWWSQCTSK